MIASVCMHRLSFQEKKFGDPLLLRRFDTPCDKSFQELESRTLKVSF